MSTGRPSPAGPAPCCRFACAWRFWEFGNTSSSYIGTYGIETLLHEMLLQSPHRWGVGQGQGQGWAC